MSGLLLPVIVLAFLYVFTVQPQRAAAVAADQRLAEGREQLARERMAVRREPAEPDRTMEVADSLARLLHDPAAGSVENLSIDTVAARDTAGASVRVEFDARYEQIGRFFWSLPQVPAPSELRSVELAPRKAPMVHAGAEIRVFQGKAPAHRPGLVVEAPGTGIAAVPQWRPNPFSADPVPPTRVVPRRAVSTAVEPGPVLSGILQSSNRRVALVDGQIVGPGDPVQGGVVQSIEAAAVVIEAPNGRTRRIELRRPGTSSTPQ